MLTREEYLKFQKESVRFVNKRLDTSGKTISKDTVKFIVISLFINLEENYMREKENVN